MLDLTKFDPTAPEIIEDPYPAYRRLRDAGPLCRGGPGEWVVTRYDEVRQMLSDPRLSVEFPEAYHRVAIGDGPAAEFRRRIVLTRDPPAHTRLRRVMHGALGSPLVRRHREHVAAVVDEMLRPALQARRIEVVAELANPLAASVLCDLIGVPADDRDEIRPRALTLATAFLPFVPESERPAVDEAVTWLRAYFDALFDERRARPCNDLVSQLATSDDSGLSREEIVDNMFFLVFSGFETTVNVIAATCAQLASRPDELRRVVGDPTLVASAVEEVLRYDATIQATGRLIREPVSIGGRRLREGRALLLLLASANRDERRFPNPDLFDVGRTDNAHLSFGGGVHVCLGAAMARMEAGVVLEALLRLTRRFELTDAPAMAPKPLFRAYSSVSLALSPT